MLSIMLQEVWHQRALVSNQLSQDFSTFLGITTNTDENDENFTQKMFL